MIKKDFIFKCRKCGHLLYLSEGVKKLIEYNCPRCGEEWEGNWVFEGMGIFKATKCGECDEPLVSEEEINFGQCDACCAWKYRDCSK